MPEVNKGALTFASMTSFLFELFRLKSKGAYEQFVVAALLHAVLDESALAG